MIFSRYERMIARRYLLPRQGRGLHLRRRGLQRRGVALGVAALIIVMSVMNGFRAELFDKIVGLNGHAMIQGVSGSLPDWRRIADAGEEDAGSHLRAADDRAAVDGDVQGPFRRRARARHARRGHSRATGLSPAICSPATSRDYARQQQGRDRLEARRHAGLLSGRRDHPDGIPTGGRPSSAPCRAR